MKGPFLLFGATAEAMFLYESCLRGDLKVTLVHDTAMEGQAPDSDYAPELSLACLASVGWVQLYEESPAG